MRVLPCFVNQTCRSYVYLGVELSQEVKVFLEVGGQDGLNHQEAEALELPVLQVVEEVELWPRHEEVPGGRRMVVLQHRAVVIQNRLQGATLTHINIPTLIFPIGCLIFVAR